MSTRALLSFAALVCAALAFHPADTAYKGSPYALATCPVSGKAIAGAGYTIVVADAENARDNGRQIRLCCAGCEAAFKADQAAMLTKVDAEMVKEQLKYYPAGSCVVMPEDELSDPRGPDAGDAKNIIVQNQLVRLCCKKCVKKVTANPEEWLAKVQAHVVAAQKPTYVLDTCVVSGEKLGDDAVDTVIASRLVRTCCSKCADKVKADPMAAFAKLDAAAAAKK